MLVSLLCSAFANSSPPAFVFDLGIAPAELAQVVVPRDGSVTHTFVSGVPWEATFTSVTRPDGVSEVQVALTTDGKIDRSLTRADRRLIRAFLDSRMPGGADGWEFELTLGGSMLWSEMFVGGEAPTREGTFAPYGLVLRESDAAGHRAGRAPEHPDTRDSFGRE